MIDANVLREQLARLEQQRQKAIEVLHQTEGAIQLCRVLLARAEAEPKPVTPAPAY